MWSPALIILILAIIMTLIQRFVEYVNRPILNQNQETNVAQNTQLSIIIVCRPGEKCDYAFNLLKKASIPQRIKLNIYKYLDTNEVTPEIPHSIRHSVRMKLFPASKLVDVAKTRINAMKEVVLSEDFICFMPSNAEVSNGWEERLLRMIKSLQQTDPMAIITSSPPLSSFDDTGVFLRLHPTISSKRLFVIENVRYKAPPDFPCPSLIWCSEFSIFSKHVQDAFAPVEELNSQVEDASHTRYLWMNGFNFYTPSSTLLWKRGAIDKSLKKRQGKSAEMKLSSPSYPVRSDAEYNSWMGLSNTGFNKRALLSMTPRASSLEYEIKYGQKENVQEIILQAY